MALFEVFFLSYELPSFLIGHVLSPCQTFRILPSCGLKPRVMSAFGQTDWTSNLDLLLHFLLLLITSWMCVGMGCVLLVMSL